MSYFLFDAVKKNSLGKLKKIIERGKSPNICDPKDKTPLHFASFEGHYEICVYLLEQGADVNSCTERWRKTPLMLASYSGKTNVCKLLLAKGADINAVDENNWSALHFAAQEKHEDTIRLLVEEGADKTIKTVPEQKTPEFVAPPNIRNLFSNQIIQKKKQIIKEKEIINPENASIQGKIVYGLTSSMDQVNKGIIQSFSKGNSHEEEKQILKSQIQELMEENETLKNKIAFIKAQLSDISKSF